MGKYRSQRSRLDKAGLDVAIDSYDGHVHVLVEAKEQEAGSPLFTRDYSGPANQVDAFVELVLDEYDEYLTEEALALVEEALEPSLVEEELARMAPTAAEAGQAQAKSLGVKELVRQNIEKAQDKAELERDAVKKELAESAGPLPKEAWQGSQVYESPVTGEGIGPALIPHPHQIHPAEEPEPKEVEMPSQLDQMITRTTERVVAGAEFVIVARKDGVHPYFFGSISTAREEKYRKNGFGFSVAKRATLFPTQ